MALENAQREDPIEKGLDAANDNNLDSKLKKLDAANDNETNIDLSPAERKRWARGETNRDQILAEKKQLQKEAEDKMREMASQSLLDPKENAKLLDEAQKFGPDKLRLLKAHLEDIAEKEGQKTKELEPNDEKLLKLEDKFNKICRKEENQKYFSGKRSIKEHEDWFKEQRLKNPSVKHLEQCLNNFENNPNADGLAKRKEFYNKQLAPKFKQYGFSSPQSSRYIQSARLKDKMAFLENVEDMERHLKTINKDLYSKHAIRNEVREMLTAKDPQEQKNRIDMAKSCARIENENYTYLQEGNNRITIGKFTIPAMSQRSMQFLLQSHQREDVGSSVRMESAKFWPSSMKFLKDLAKKLEKTLEKHPELLEKAVGIFKNLSDDAKIDLVKKYETLTEESTNKEEIEAKAMLSSAITEIDKAKKGKYISAKTADHFKENFEEGTYKDPNTGRYDTKKIEARFKILTSTRPITDQKDRNLAAYFEDHQEYLDHINEWKEINPEMTKEQAAKMRDEYEKSSWSKKRKQHLKLEKDLHEHKAKKEKVQEITQETGQSEKSEKTESAENKLEWGLLLRQIANLEAEGQYGEIVSILLTQYNNLIQDPDSSEKDETLLWEKLSHYRSLSKQFGKGEKIADNAIDELEANMESIVEGDEEIKRDLDEQQAQTLGIELTEMSQRRFSEKTDAQDRAKKESLQSTQSGSDAEKLTEDFYEIGEQEGDDETVLDKYGQAKEVTTIELDNDSESSETDLQELRSTIHKHQNKIDTKEGDTSFQVTDEKGKTLKADEAKKKQEEELNDLTQKLSEKAIDKTADKTGQVFDLNERIAARRDAKARDLIDKKRFEKLKSAA